MKLDEAKYRFIQEWGVLGSNWGINRAMAQIQAILLLSPESLTTDEIMEGLKMSRGNVNMNVRALMDWGLVFKEFKPGARDTHFTSPNIGIVIAPLPTTLVHPSVSSLSRIGITAD